MKKAYFAAFFEIYKIDTFLHRSILETVSIVSQIVGFVKDNVDVSLNLISNSRRRFHGTSFSGYAKTKTEAFARIAGN